MTLLRSLVVVPGASAGVVSTAKAGALPALEWMSLKVLRVDDRYQRPISKPGQMVIQRIMQDFSWAKFSPVIVTLNEEGSFSIIDGQHRCTAALSLGFTQVPCMVVNAPPEEAAGIFAAINGTTTPMTVQSLFKASRAAGVAWAVAVDRVCKRHGVTPLVYPVPSGKQRPLMTNAVGSLRKVYERHGEPILSAALACLVVAKDAQQPGFLTSNLITQYASMFLSRPGWVRDQTRLKARFAETIITLAEPSHVEAMLERSCGNGRSDDDDWPKVLARVQDLHQRKFSTSMIAAQLRLPYAEVERAVAALPKVKTAELAG
jgi:hypothetical protein